MWWNKRQSEKKPVDNERQRPFNDVVKWEGLKPAERHVCRLCVDDGLLLFGLNGQHPQQLSDDIMRHQVNLWKDQTTFNPADF